MINLDEKKDYYIMVDLQGANFCSYRIYEGLQEIVEQFQEYADSDGYDDPRLIGWTIADCLENWDFELQKYTGKEFRKTNDMNVLGYKITSERIIDTIPCKECGIEIEYSITDPHNLCEDCEREIYKD